MYNMYITTLVMALLLVFLFLFFFSSFFLYINMCLCIICVCCKGHIKKCVFFVSLKGLLLRSFLNDKDNNRINLSLNVVAVVVEVMLLLYNADGHVVVVVVGGVVVAAELDLAVTTVYNDHCQIVL